jgi:uncharacterized protein (TIGR02452 family)
VNGEFVDISEAQKSAADSRQNFPPTHVFGALRHLMKIEGESNSVALNFANPITPGGGFLNWAVAQEEAICRCSVLYDLLLTLPEMYEKVDPNDPLFTDYMNLLRNVPIIRDDQYDFLEKPFFASFITCAAPLAFRYWQIESNGERLYSALQGRIRKIVQCAIAGGFTNIVLGAFGCGAFANKSEDVAQMFREVLIKEGLRRHFRKIVFAIYSGSDEDNKMEIFNEALPKGKSCQVA